MKPMMIFLFLALVSFSSCKQETPVTEAAPATPQPVDMAALKAEMQDMENKWAAAINQKDLPALMAMFADDAISMPYNAPAIAGKAAIEEHQKKQFADAKENVTIAFETTDVYGDNNTVTEFGKSVEKDDKGNIVGTGKYCAVFQKRDGQWLCIREIYNSDMAAK